MAIKLHGCLPALAALTFCCVVLGPMTLAVEPQDEKQAKGEAGENLLRENLVAWCIVPFDASKRTPSERAEMLEELGIKHFAYDWREEHVPTWDDELDQLNQRGIELTAFWSSTSLTPEEDAGTRRIVDFLKRRKVATQLWIMLPDQELAKIEDETSRLKTAVSAVRGLAEKVAPLGCTVGLYNHGGWVGKPSTLVQIMEALQDLDNVGVVYNFHHAHNDLGDFPDALHKLKPHLLCLNLNGTTAAGPKIQTIGEGELDEKILNWIKEVDYRGPVGILDHRPEMDAKESLEANLLGLERLLGSQAAK